MARIPLQVAQRGLDTGPLVSYPQGGGPIGAAVERAGDVIGAVAMKVQQKQDQQAAFDARVREMEFSAQLSGLEQDAETNAAIDGSGIHDGVYGQIDPVTNQAVKPGSFDHLFDSYLERMPESKRADFAAKREVYRLDGSNRLAGAEYKARQAYEKVQIDKAELDITNAMAAGDPNDIDTFDRFKQQGIDLIENSGLPALEKDVAKTNWLANADETLFKTKLAKDPEFAGKARAALGLAPPSPGYNDPSLPAGMRNNNPGNIKFVGQGRDRGVIGPSENTDQGDPQAVFATPEAGMAEAVRLARAKYAGGKRTANQLIAGDNGWTPGNYQAAKNIAASMGIGPDDNLNLDDPGSAVRFMRALVTQEHGPASNAYSDAMIRDAVANSASARVGRDLPIVIGKQAGRVSAPDMSGVSPAVLERFKSLQNAFGKSLPVVSGYRDPERNARARGAKSSQHMHGNALDIDVSGLSEAERLQVIRQATASGFTGIGVYKNSIHVDTGPRRSWGWDHHSGSVPEWARGAITEHMNAKGVVPGAPVPSAPDPAFANIPLDRRWVLANQADAALNDRRAEARGAIEVAVTNAPIAMQNTGEYSGPLPGYDAFAAAYGPEEGAQRYNSFQVAMDTGRQVFAMQTMPEAQVKALVADALPTASGETAALDQQRYTAISNAADATLKARAADPAEYVRNAFPSVRSAWSNAQPGEGYQQAVAVSVAAQEQLGITDIKPLPKVAAENVVNRFKDVNLPENDRFSAVFSAMMSTQDAGQRRAIFEQLVDAGLPDITEGAVEALARGDTGAGRRLLQAAVIDPDKLPGQSPEKPAAIKEAIQSALMDDGQIGDIYYGLSDGTAENFVRAERDSKLLSNAVNLRLRSGEALEDAVNSAAKDLYGDVQIVDSAGRLNAQVLIPADQDAEAVSAGLSALEPKVRDAVTKALAVPADAPTQDGTKAILNAATSNYAENVLAEGYFRNSGSGFVFIDPYVGAAIADESGKPVIFTMQEILAAQPKRDARTPSGPLTDDAFDRFQQRFGQ